MDSLKDKHRTYLKHYISQNFIIYPDVPYDKIFEIYWELKDVLMEDIVFWHPNFGDIITYENYLEHLQVAPNWEAVYLYRISNYLFKHNEGSEILPFLATLMKLRAGAELYYSTDIGKRFILLHGEGTVIGPRCKVGDEFCVYQGVTVGQQHRDSGQNSVIGNNVSLFAGCKILGSVTIGDNVWVGANVVVTKNLESNGVYAGAPARRIRELIGSN